MSSLTFSKQFSGQRLRLFKRAVARKVLHIGLRAARLSSIGHAIECMATSPFARHNSVDFYSLCRLYLRFVGADAEKLDLLVRHQAARRIDT